MNDQSRILSFEAIENARDYGGYAARDGRRIRSGFLYRTAHHGFATDADLERLAALELGVIVDLRRPTERARAPSRRPERFAATVISNDLDDEEVDAFHRHLISSDHSVQSMRTFMADYYRNALFERRHIDLYRRYFLALAEAERPILIHCAAGKDRTGLLAALTHRLVGVAEDDTMRDFLLTNDHARFERRAPLFAAFVQDLTGRTPSDAALHAAMGVEAEYLHIAFDQAGARYGSVDGYIEQALGVDAALRQRIEARLLA